MTGKERAGWRAKANSLTPLFQIGKGGMSDAIIKQTDDALTARELIKVHVLENSMLDVREAAGELAQKTASQVVIVMGSKLVLYRRSDKNICEM